MNKLFNMLGLCARANRLVSGEQAVEISLKKGSAKLVVADGDAAENTKKAIKSACLNKDVPMITVSGQSLGDAIGKPGRMLAAVTDESFAARIYQLFKENG